MTTPDPTLLARLEELAERASQGMKVLDEARVNANATTQDIDARARVELEAAGRTLREATDRRLRATA